MDAMGLQSYNSTLHLSRSPYYEMRISHQSSYALMHAPRCSKPCSSINYGGGGGALLIYAGAKNGGSHHHYHHHHHHHSLRHHHHHEDPLMARNLASANNIGGFRPSLVFRNPANTSHKYTASSSSSSSRTQELLEPSFLEPLECVGPHDLQYEQYEQESSPSGLAIVPFLHDKNIFITGATGFVAKGIYYDQCLLH